MRRISYLLTLSILALLMLVPAAKAQQSQSTMGQPTSNVWSVSIEDFYFEPADTAVQPGDTIMWVNEGNHPHTVTSDDGQFDSGVLNPGDAYEVTFTGQGTITYHCSIHSSMMGSVSVGQSGGGTAPSASPPPMPAAPMPMSSGYGGGY